MTDAGSPQRPWGFVEVLTEEGDHKVTRLTLTPGGRLSLQRHQRRLEHWYVVKGTAIATVGDKKLKLSAGSSLDVPVRTVHRLENPGSEPFVLIETQVGKYFGDDDIERIEDDYGRI